MAKKLTKNMKEVQELLSESLKDWKKDMGDFADDIDDGEAEVDLLASLVWCDEVDPQTARRFAVMHFGWVPMSVDEATRACSA